MFTDEFFQNVRFTGVTGVVKDQIELLLGYRHFATCHAIPLAHMFLNLASCDGYGILQQEKDQVRA